MDKLNIEGLECTICLQTINEPKLLSCSHTFCKTCLDRLSDAQVDQTRIPCPVCKKVTAVPNGEVGQLQTYGALQSIIDDMKSMRNDCTLCEVDDPPPADSYCQDCRKYMCDPCEKVHAQWKAFAGHQVVGMSDVQDSKITLKKRSTCQKHPQEDPACFCTECRSYICFCQVLGHTRKGHEILEAEEHEENISVNINDLRSKSNVRKDTIQKYVTYVEEQLQRMDEVLKDINGDIDSAYDDSVQQLTKRRDLLKGEVERRIEELEITLKDMHAEGHRQIIQVEAGTELISRGTGAPLEKEALTAHDTLCADLSTILEHENPDYKMPTMASKKGEKIHFERNKGSNELQLGRVQVAEWVVKNVEFPVKNSITAMSATPDGTMALAVNTGGIDMFTEEGQLVTSILKNQKIREIEFLSDGRFVLRDKVNTISVFNRACEHLSSIRFETMRYEEAGVGDLGVDAKDNIYVGYRKARIIQVFKPTGGRAFREIPCDEYEPSQVFALKTKNNLLVQSHSNSVRLIDYSGAMLQDVTLYDNIYAYPAVCADDTIMIAWVKHEDGLVTIDQYSKDLKHVTTLVADSKIQKPDKRHWYYLQEFVGTGTIGLCTPDRMYIYKQSVASAKI